MLVHLPGKELSFKHAELLKYIFMIHKEGQRLLFFLFFFLAIFTAVAFWQLPEYGWIAGVGALLLFLVVLQFFRNPRRTVPRPDNQLIYAPADGKVVVIEETEEPEYFKDRRKQVSIFMSPVNVHVNRNPVSGTVEYVKYHPGKYLVAWHPKSSTENERTTVVLNTGRHRLLMRQIAGAMAKRIKNYLTEGQKVTQGDDFGFIKFGSRVDLFLPLDARIDVKIGQKVKGNITVIGSFNDQP